MLKRKSSRIIVVTVIFTILVSVGVITWLSTQSDTGVELSIHPEPILPVTVVNIERHPGPVDMTYFGGILTSLPAYDENEFKLLDLRYKDLSKLDLTDRLDDLLNSWFDSGTVWPSLLPEGFNPQEIMELGNNPGLGIRSLHEQGINGSGVNIAIIDQCLLVDHEEFKDRVILYEETEIREATSSMHGPSMASIAVGKNIGTAPGAGLYFISAYNFDPDWTLNLERVTEGIRRIIEINKTLSQEDKIRVLSISLMTSPVQKGYEDYMKAIQDAETEGIFVLSCNLFETSENKFWFYGLDRNPLDDPESFNSYNQVSWEDWLLYGCKNRPGVEEHYVGSLETNMDSEFLLVPMMSRNYASLGGAAEYSFTRIGGLSTIEPWLAGVYAMCCQVMPDITPEIFWEKALETGEERTIQVDGKDYTGKIVNPVKLIDELY